MTNKKAKIILLFVFVIIVAIAVLTYFIFFYTHNVSFELADEMDNVQISADNRIYTHYYFIKDSKYSSWYDGEERFKESFPNYDFSKLDTKKYTYLVLFSGNLNSVKYSGKNCKQRTIIFPYEYTAFVDADKTGDGSVKIYRMKKINIEYDYHGDEGIVE